MQPPSGFERPRPELNALQQAPFDAIRSARAERVQHISARGRHRFRQDRGLSARHRSRARAAAGMRCLLVPEIAFTPAVAGQFFHRFGKQVAILHSAFGDAESADQWRRIRNGQARVVVGTRSGVFAPVQNLGLLVVDEEHDGSYKQGETPRYHGRDVALVRARNAAAVAILGSATPSVETRYNAEQQYVQAAAAARTYRATPDAAGRSRRHAPRVSRNQKAGNLLPRRLLAEMQQRLAQGSRSCCCSNRRGFSSFLVCRACGERMLCVNCSVALTHHRRDRRMLCHYCGYAEKIPSACPQCGSDYIQFLGTGSERVEDELHQYFPTARIARLDRDSARGKGSFERILHGFRDDDIDILVGTQMIAKGHDIPNVTLVGRGARRYRSEPARFSRRRAQLSAPDASRRTRRSRRSYPAASSFKP